MSELLERLRQALADRYSVERELGQGGMATVYLALERHPQRQVAIKVLDPALAAVLGPERFLREVELACGLTHPNILPVFAAAEAGGLLYYVMPYVEGESLRDRLTREKQLPLEDAVRIAREVADALNHAHGHGVIHRDIKPENILLEAGHAVVADFGIARAIDRAGGKRLTETGLVVGTPAYMSPEQASGTRDLDGRSDVYSLGCVLYEMLIGEVPYTGATPMAVLAKKMTGRLPRVSVIRQTVPPGVEAALDKALERTPADRWATAAEFAAVLEHPYATGAPRASWFRRATGGRPPVGPGGLPRWAKWATAVASLGVVLGAIAVGRWLLPSRGAARHPRTAIAVLPLENLGAQGPYTYFAGGLHDELLTQLAKVAALTVIGRTSVSTYQGTSKRLRQIADELSVGSIVEGSVQVLGNRLRVIVQLIDPATETHIWAETYDRTLTDAFAVQSDIAQRIVAGVGATLTSSEAGAIAAAPTRNAGAYDLYVQGLGYYRRPGYQRANLEVAQRLYERALALDPRFALAHAALSTVHGNMYWFRYDPSPARAELQQREAEVALRLAPDLPQAHAAMGDAYYLGHRDYQRALEEYHLALRGAPNDAGLWAYIGYVQRRLGNWDSVEVAFQHATLLDPRDANLFADLGANTYLVTRRYPEALRALERAATLAPDLPYVAATKGLVYLFWKGELDTLRAALRALPPDAELGSGAGTAELEHAELLLLDRQPDSLLSLLRASRAAVFADQDWLRPLALYAAWAHVLRGDTAAASAALDSATVLLDSIVRVLPHDWRVHAARGQALAGLGRRAEAAHEAQWLERSAEYRRDVLESGFVAAERGQILARIGETAAALAAVERMLASPTMMSVAWVRLDPRWDPIRADPRFQALLVKYANTDVR